MIISARRRCHRRPNLVAEYDIWSPGMSELFGETDGIYRFHLSQDEFSTIEECKLHAVAELRKTIAFHTPHTHVVR